MNEGEGAVEEIEEKNVILLYNIGHTKKVKKLITHNLCSEPKCM